MKQRTIRRSVEIVKCIRKLLLLRQTTFCDPVRRVGVPFNKRVKMEMESSQILSITEYTLYLNFKNKENFNINCLI